MMLGVNRHIDEEEVERYSRGTVPEEQLAQVEEHLLVCETCQNRVQKADEYQVAMNNAAEELRKRPPVRIRPMFGMRLAPIFAGAAAFAVLAVTGLELSRRSAAPAYLVELEATRGASVLAKAPAGRALALQLEVGTLEPQPVYRLEVVDGAGRSVWRGEASPRDSKVTASLPRLGAGYYFIRIYGLSGALLREYGLEVA